MTLRRKFALAMSGLVAVAIGAVGILTIFSERRLLLRDMDEHQLQSVQRLARVSEESLYQNDLLLLNYFKTLESERAFLLAAFVDSSGKVRTASDFSLVGHSLSSPNEADAGSATAVFRQTYVRTGGSHVLDLPAPIRFSGGRAGTARLLFDDSALQSYVRQSVGHTLRRIGLITVGTFLAALYAPLVQQNGLVLHVEVSSQPLMVQADRDKIFHALANLASNALKFTKKGSVSVSVAEKNGAAVVSVADTGPGVAAAEKSRLFDKFFRTKSAAATKGTGLELFIVKMLVESHGGKIWIDDNVGTGAIFRFSLPKTPPF